MSRDARCLSYSADERDSLCFIGYSAVLIAAVGTVFRMLWLLSSLSHLLDAPGKDLPAKVIFSDALSQLFFFRFSLGKVRRSLTGSLFESSAFSVYVLKASWAEAALSKLAVHEAISHVESIKKIKKKQFTLCFLFFIVLSSSIWLKGPDSSGFHFFWVDQGNFAWDI